MAIIRTPGGIKVIAEVPKKTFPKQIDWYKLPPVNSLSSYLTLTLESVSGSGRKAIRVVNNGILPGNASKYTLYFTGYQGSRPASPSWQTLPVVLVNDTFSILIGFPEPNSNYAFFLSYTNESGKVQTLSESLITTPADDSYTNLQTLLTSVSDITADGKLTLNEKVLMASWWANVTGEKTDLDNKASLVGVSATAYDAAYSALSAVAASTWQAGGTTDISAMSPTLYTLWSNYWTEKLKLQNAITEKANTGVTQLNSVDYLTNADKIKLMQDWTAEQNTQTQLQSQANSLSISHSSYDTAVTAIDTYLGTTLGYSTWKSSWPDGVTNGPNSGVLNTIRNYWNTVATQRAILQLNISNQQAINQGNTAISTAAMDATTKSNAVAITVPKTVTGMPTLPDAINYPSGRLIYETGTKKLYRSTGSTWESATVTPADIVGTLSTSQVSGIWPAGQIPVIDFSSGIGGAAKPANNATVGAPSGTPVGNTTADNAASAATNYLGQAVKITLTGNNTTFYPVMLKAIGYQGGDAAINYDFTVCRPNVHEDSSNLSSYSATCLVRAYAWGHAYGAIKKIDQNTGSGTYNYGLGNLFTNTAGGGIILMLRGGMTHTVSLSQPLGTATLTAYMSGYTDGTGANYQPTISSPLSSYLDMSYRPNAQLHGGQSIVGRSVTADRIVANSLTSNEILARTITADRIATNAITANEIAANTITSQQIAAKSIYADSLVISNFDNLIPNPNSEQPAPAGGWPAGAYESIGLVAVSGTSGTHQRYLAAGWNQIAPLIPCAPGDQFYFEAQTLSDSTSSNARIAVDFLDSNGGWITGSYATNNTSGWVKTSTVGTCPSNASFCRFLIGGETANSHYDDMYARKLLSGSLVVDGTITGNKVAARTITANNLVADSITAAEIAAGAIGTNELSAGSVTASKMVMVGASLVADSCFESGQAGWNGHTGSIIPGSSLSGCPGKFAGQFNARDCYCKVPIPVAAGEKYFCSMSMYAYGGSGSGGMGIVVFGFDRSGNTVEGYCLTSTTNTSSWVTLSGTITVGASTVSLAVGPWMDLPYTWVSANGGPLFTNLVLRKMNDASLIVDGAITANKLSGNSIQTSNYNESGGNPTAGCKMDIQGTALKVAPNNLQVGQYVATDAFFRAFNALDGSNSSGKAFYKGNIDNSSSHLYGAPNIGCFYVQSSWQQTAAARFMLNFFLRPTAVTDNLDAMRYAKIDFYRGNASSASLIMTGYVTLSDRLYAHATDSNAANMSAVSQYFENDAASGILSGNDPRFFLLITIYNAYGPSDTKWFIPPSSLNTDWTQQTSAPFTSGSSGGSGGGSGGSGSCPSPETLIDTITGQVMAKDIQVGMVVRTLNENTFEYGEYEVEAVETGINDLYTLTLEDGRSFDFAGNHRFLTDVAWMELQVMTPGTKILGDNPGIVKSVVFKEANAEVMKITVASAHTYQTSGLISHNVKQLN